MRKSLACALLVSAALAAPTLAVPPGNVNGEEEQPQITGIDAIRLLEQQALAIAAGADQNAPLDVESASSVSGKVSTALTQLAALKASLLAAGPYQETTLAAEAVKRLEEAEKFDNSCLKKIEEGKNASAMVFYLQKAERSKGKAQLAMMGIHTVPKDDAAIAANNVSSQTVPHDADISGNKKSASPSKKNKDKGLADAMNARAQAKKRKYPKYEGLSVAGAAFAPPADYYYAFEGTTANPGYIFNSLGRRLFGPFETRFQVGSFKFGDTVDTGSACIEFDVEGSSPLQFVAVCGRRIEGGVQVFVQSHDGPAGNLFLSGATIAQVLVTHSGTQFVVKAASGIGAPDFVLQNVATVNLTQGETALVAGLGASGLTKGAEIGLDEIFFTAQ